MKSSFVKLALRAFPVLLAVLILVKTGTATTAILLTDEQLITSSRCIMIGEVRSLKAGWDLTHRRIYTYVKVQVSEVLKGQLRNEQIVFKQLGGTVGDTSSVIFGTPDYQVGERVLLFLDTASDGTLRIAHLFMGKYGIVQDLDSGRTMIERNIDRGSINLQGLEVSPDITNRATLKKFNKRIKTLLAERTVEVAAYDEKYSAVPIVEIPAEYVDDGALTNPGEVISQFTFLGSGYRWTQPDTNQPVVYRVNPAGAPVGGGGVTEVNLALAAWSNVQTTALTLQNGGSTTAGGFVADGVSAISFNDPLNEITDPTGCSGILAIGGVSSAGGTTTVNGQTFTRILEGDVVFNNNFQCFLGNSTNLAEVACHEIGHSIGFGHSAESAAIMFASAHGQGRGATLGNDDIAAVTFLYPGSHSGGGGTGFTIGVYRPSTATFYLRTSNTPGPANLTIPYGAIGDLPLVGDWDGDGDVTIGVYRPGNQTFYLRNSNSVGPANMAIPYGANGDVPLVGDWDGNGSWTIGVYRPSTATFYLRNSNSIGVANLSIPYGAIGDQPLVGDWNGDGSWTIGVYRPATVTFYLRNANSIGFADISVPYGASGDQPILGDWDGNGSVTLGLYRPGTTTFYLRNNNSIGIADLNIPYGASGDKPLAGKWN